MIAKKGREIEAMVTDDVLLPGLPDEIALECLARVPARFQPGLRPVCRRWRELVSTASFHRHRLRIGAAEDLIFLVQALVASDGKLSLDPAADEDEEDDRKEAIAGQHGRRASCRPPVYGLSVYNATAGTWHRVAFAEPIPLFAQVAAVGRRVVVVGGWDPATFEPVAEVRVLDLATGTWRRGAPMGSGTRSFFACAAAGGRVYVAGGHDGGKNALRTAEAYDAAADEWTALPAMGEERDECKGVASGGRFWAVSGYGTEGQGRFGDAAEWYDEATGEWRREDGVWEAAAATAEEDGVPDGATAAALVAVGEGRRMWSVECGGSGRRGVREYEGSGRGWKEVAPVPEEMRSSPCAVPVGAGAGERVLVMAGEGEGGTHSGWMLEVATRKWTRLETPTGFSGFVYSAASVRI